MYDVIIVGARLAGSGTALLLARAGLKVLVIDRARFPSDTLSTHQLQVPGGARLARWGLLDKIISAGTPAAATARFDTAGGIRVEGRFPSLEGVSAVYSPRRMILDSVLLDAARDAGAEVAQATTVEELDFRDGRVNGVRFATKGAGRGSAAAAMVIGADGKKSMVARSVGARVTKEQPARTLACYTYWSDVELAGGWIVNTPETALGVWPTNDGLVMSYVARPAAVLAQHRTDQEQTIVAALQGSGELGERVLSGRRVEHVRATVDVPNMIRASAGPGWALAGDAGLVMDPISGQGMGNALRDADLLSEALIAGLGGTVGLDKALRAYVSRRDRETKAMFDFTVGLTGLAAPSAAEQALFAAIAASRAESDLFFAVLTGASPLTELFAPGHLLRLLGPRGLVRLMRTGPKRSRDTAPIAAQPV